MVSVVSPVGVDITTSMVSPSACAGSDVRLEVHDARSAMHPSANSINDFVFIIEAVGVAGVSPLYLAP